MPTRLVATFLATDNLHVRLFHATEVVIDQSWNDRGVCSAFWRYYVNYRSGAAVRLADGSLHDLPPGFVHLIPAWVTIDLVNRREVNHLYAHFDLVGLPGALAREVFARPVSLPEDDCLRATSQAMRAALHAPDGQASALFPTKSAIDAAVGALFARLPAAQRDRLAAAMRTDSPVAPALRAIDADPALTLRVEALAGLCDLGEGQFTRLFRGAVGQTPGQYILERRIAAAAQRLVLSDEPIEAIAEACGFADRFYFTRVFTKRMGTPPAAYRKAEPFPRGRPVR
jgi:AraC-like DNA-binding protein